MAITHRYSSVKVKSLFLFQVGKLYIRYQLDVADSDEAVVELQDVICLLKDEKELYIQKDHLSAKLDIGRCGGNRPIFQVHGSASPETESD